MRDKNALKRLSQSSLADLFSVLMGRRATGILALKNEYLVGFISLVLLNILLLFINIIDLKYVWLGFTSSADVNLAEYVHEGTGLLIFSIVLAMLLLLFFFRGNLNFYRKNKWLKYGAYLWIFQNLFLVISVLMRDYYYISHYGLAYKRIGLLFFLLMVLVGLVTVFLKILEIKTSYYLLRVNAWAGIFLLITASTIHWDETIARYNLDRKDTIPLDVAFLLSLSDKTLPILIENKDVLEKTTVSYFNYNEHGYSGSAMNFLDYRINEFLEKQKEYSWLSWNMADEVVKRNLEVSKNIVAAK